MPPERIASGVLAPLEHGFFTRRGGVSRGIYAGLNCGSGSGDDPGAVARNRARVAKALGVTPARLISLHQVHSADVVTLRAPLPASPTQPRPRADALVTARPGLAISVLSADCQPVLFADIQAGVIGAAHAGWKGALGGVLEATVAAMEALGAARARIRATIGPTISQAAYEVGPEFRARFLAADPAHGRFFAPGAGERWQFDLPGFSLARLEALGLARATWTGHCTYGDPDRFYSWRRTCHEGRADYGRLIAAIRL